MLIQIVVPIVDEYYEQIGELEVFKYELFFEVAYGGAVTKQAVISYLDELHERDSKNPDRYNGDWLKVKQSIENAVSWEFVSAAFPQKSDCVILEFFKSDNFRSDTKNFEVLRRGFPITWKVINTKVLSQEA